MKMKKGFRQLVDEAKARITTISLDEAKRRHGRDDVVFVDLRDVRELEREGMIPGAFVFYCNGAWRSALATDVAAQMGLPRVVEMDGGFTAWKSAGLPVAERARKPAS